MTLKKQQEDEQAARDKITEVRRSLRLNTQIQTEKAYCELDESECMESDGDLDQEMQQYHL